MNDQSMRELKERHAREIKEFRRLTEFLGECWHEWVVAYPNGAEDVSMRGHTCALCGKYWPVQRKNGPVFPRTFTTWQDLGDLKDKLAEKGEWEEFELHAEDLFWEAFYSGKLNPPTPTPTDWLINAKRFCSLVAAFIEDKNREGG